MIRLRDGETNMLAGLIRDDERRSLDGIPGLSDLPVVGRLFAHTQRTTDQTDIILTLTPHIIRVLDLTEADLRPFRVGRDSLAPSICRCPPDAARAPPAPRHHADGRHRPPPPTAPTWKPTGTIAPRRLGRCRLRRQTAHSTFPLAPSACSRSTRRP